jgi:hypothetical protein
MAALTSSSEIIYAEPLTLVTYGYHPSPRLQFHCLSATVLDRVQDEFVDNHPNEIVMITPRVWRAYVNQEVMDALA